MSHLFHNEWLVVITFFTTLFLVCSSKEKHPKETSHTNLYLSCLSCIHMSCWKSCNLFVGDKLKSVYVQFMSIYIENTASRQFDDMLLLVSSIMHDSKIEIEFLKMPMFANYLIFHLQLISFFLIHCRYLSSHFIFFDKLIKLILVLILALKVAFVIAQKKRAINA